MKWAGGSNPERRQGEATREGTNRQGKQAGNYSNAKITVLPLRLTFDFSKINKLRPLVTSSYDLQNFRTLYPRTRLNEYYNFNVTHFRKFGAKNKSRIYAN